jgi:hypothetical protein
MSGTTTAAVIPRLCSADGSAAHAARGRWSSALSPTRLTVVEPSTCGVALTAGECYPTVSRRSCCDSLGGMLR